MKTVAVVLIEGFDPFEFGVLCEVFGEDRTLDGVPPIEFRVCGERPGDPLLTRHGMQVAPTHSLDAASAADVVIAAAATVRDDYPPAVLQAFRAAAERGATLLSVCTGAYVLGAAGLLDGRRCTTHWRHAEAFARRFPDARLDPGVLFVDDGDVLTSAGSVAGIDACLHLVRRELGSEPANTIARRMVVPPQREGGQRQFIDLPVPQSHCESVQPVLDWMLENLGADHAVADLARRVQMSDRTFARKFVAETGTTPNKWLTTQRVSHARRLLEQTDLGIDEIASACGFSSGALLRHHFHRVVGVAPKEYRRTFTHRIA